MIINVDVDGVLADMIQLAIAVSYKELGILIDKEEIDDFYYSNSRYSIPDIVNNYILKDDRLLYAPVIGCSVWAIEELFCWHDTEIFITSARPVELKQLTKDWLMLNKFSYNHLQLLGELSKGDVDGTILIDDHSKNVIEWLESDHERYAVLFPQPWNKKYRNSLMREYGGRILIPKGNNYCSIWKNLSDSLLKLVATIGHTQRWIQLSLP